MINRVEELHEVNVFFRLCTVCVRVRSEWIKIQKGVLATGCPSHVFVER